MAQEHKHNFKVINMRYYLLEAIEGSSAVE